jgi:RNA polymerase sigma-70 factor, ECF subfamily
VAVAVFDGQTLPITSPRGAEQRVGGWLAVLLDVARRRLFTLAQTPTDWSKRGITELSGPSIAAAGAPGARPGLGGTAGFDAFFLAFERPLYGYVRRMVGSEEDAVDITQEAFFRAWSHFDDIAAFDRPAAWLYRVATNLALDHLRRRLPVSLTLLAGQRDDDADAEAGEWLTDSSSVAVAAAERDAIERALRRLPERQRAALLLRAVHGLTCSEIARALDLTPDAARQTLSRARSRFRHMYESSEGGDSDAVTPPR